MRAAILAQQPNGEGVAPGGEGITLTFGSQLVLRCTLYLRFQGGQGCSGHLVVGIKPGFASFHRCNVGFQGGKLLGGFAVPHSTGSLALVEAANFSLGGFHPGTGRCNLAGQLG